MTESDAEKIQQQAKQPEVPTPDQKQEIKAAAVKTAPVKSSRKTAAKKTTSAAKKTTKAVKEEKASAAVNLDSPSLYTNREISWIEFDRKVLETAEDRKVPLLDRVKFLAIFFNNLDEFYMVRVMNLQRQARSNVLPTGPDKMPPAKQLVEIRRRVGELLDEAEELWLKDLKPALEKKDVHFITYDELTGVRRQMVDKYFETEILPVLTPQGVDAGRPFPMISSRSINFVIELRSTDPSDEKSYFARLKNPNNVPRFLFVPKDLTGEETIDFASGDGDILMMEDLVANRMGMLFPGYKVKNYGMFRVTRNTDGEIEEDEADDLLAAVRDYVEQRRFGSIVRVELARGMPLALQDFLISHLDVHPSQVVRLKMPLAFNDFMRLMKIDKPALKYPPFRANTPKPFDPEEDLFAEIRERDLMVFHPYDSFGCVLRFLRQAAVDPDVVAIKQTLYRCGSDSPVVRALLEARRRGKQVTAVVELKARFDEERNINWAEEMEKAGVNIVYGFVGLKIHAKLCLVVRREADGMKRYVHISTGNYNPSSAKIYTDYGLLTADNDICADVSDLFNVMTGYSDQTTYRRLVVSPHSTRSSIVAAIEREAAEHQKTGKGEIIFKCNQLVDRAVIQALYAASQAGVKISLIVRGICCLRPNIPGISDNIQVVSIVGRFLEHARAYWFRNNDDPFLLIGSADLMPRNLDGRIEVLVPVLDPAIRSRIKATLDLQLADNVQSWKLQSDGTYVRLAPPRHGKAVDSQEVLAKHYGRVE